MKKTFNKQIEVLDWLFNGLSQGNNESNAKENEDISGWRHDYSLKDFE